jgi:hypothetical protein
MICNVIGILLLVNGGYQPEELDLPPADVLDRFSSGQYRSAEWFKSNRSVQYRLFRPLNVEPNRTYPLIVWLHGYGDAEFKLANTGQLQHVGLIVPSKKVAENLAAFILAVQCPTDQPGFFGTSIREELKGTGVNSPDNDSRPL